MRGTGEEWRAADGAGGRGEGEKRERVRMWARVCARACTAVYKARAYVHTSYVWRSSYYTPFMHRVRRRAALRRDESSIRLNARQPGDALNQGCLPEHTNTHTHTYTSKCARARARSHVRTYVRAARLFEIPILRRASGRTRREMRARATSTIAPMRFPAPLVARCMSSSLA